MMIVENGVDPEDIVNVIKLPEIKLPAAAEKSRPEAGAAEEAKALGKEFGQQVAEEARSQGRTIAEEVRSDVAEEARRNRGKGRGRD